LQRLPQVLCNLLWHAQSSISNYGIQCHTPTFSLLA
jgi:hypothetical protein